MTSSSVFPDRQVLTWQAIAEWVVIGTLATWLMVVLHEAGHFLPSLLLFPDAGPARASSVARRIVFAGGPLVSQMIIAWACWSARKFDAQALPTPTRGIMFAVTFGLAAASRAILLASVAAIGTWSGDETALAREFDTSAWMFLGIEVPIAIVAIVWLIRLLPRPRQAHVIAAVGGVVFGWVSMIVIGPRLGLPI